MSEPSTSNHDEQVRWGVIGPGSIAETVAGDLARVDGSRILAVASRAEERAKAFADRHSIERPYGSYAELLRDPDVDVVYIATPHAQHHALALAALRAGKSLLVEKAFTTTVAGAREVVDLARSTDRFAMEGVWMRFHPAIRRLHDLVRDGAIGEVRTVQAAMGLAFPYDPTSRLFDHALGGGFLLDGGVYPVSFAQMILGAPDSVHAAGSLFPTGVDAEVAMLLGYEDGRTATVTGSMRCSMPPSARVVGTAGWIEVAPPFLRAERLTLVRTGHDPETIEEPIDGRGYVAELTEVVQCVRTGRTESSVMPLTDTVAVLEVLEEAAAQLGVHFTEDASVFDPTTD